MTDDFYKKAFDSAVVELSALTEQRDKLKKDLEALDERIEKVRQGALGLTALADIDFQEIKEKHPGFFDNEFDPRIGITDAVREALRTSDETLTPKEIKERVFSISPAVAGHKNPMASIHAVLRRLEENDEIITGVDDLDRTTYGWIASGDAEERLRRWFTNGEEVWERMSAKRKRKKG